MLHENGDNQMMFENPYLKVQRLNKCNVDNFSVVTVLVKFVMPEFPDKKEFEKALHTFSHLADQLCSNENEFYCQVMDVTECDVVPVSWVLSVVDTIKSQRHTFYRKLVATAVIHSNNTFYKFLTSILEKYYDPIKPLAFFSRSNNDNVEFEVASFFSLYQHKQNLSTFSSLELPTNL